MRNVKYLQEEEQEGGNERELLMPVESQDKEVEPCKGTEKGTLKYRSTAEGVEWFPLRLVECPTQL